MRKNVYINIAVLIILAIVTTSCNGQKNSEKKEIMGTKESEQILPISIYEFEVIDIEGNKRAMSEFKGKKLLIVNTASECGLTPQYEQLQELYDSLGGNKFEIIGFPSNNFGGQEPRSEDEIVSFCQKNYGVTFPMMSKVSVKGENVHPLYAWLIAKEIEKSGNKKFEPVWNFHKFMIDEKGKYVGQLHPQTLPVNKKLLEWIQN